MLARPVQITALLLLALLTSGPAAGEGRFATFAAPAGDRPHDVSPGPDGTVYYTGQGAGVLGWLDPRTGKIERIRLGANSAPHGVITGSDGMAWITDSGQNAIVSFDPRTRKIAVYKLPDSLGYTNLNTAAFDRSGTLWFTGQTGIYGRLDPRTGKIDVWDAPGGRGPYGITGTKSGDIYYASLAGSYVGRVNIETGQATVLEPPTRAQGARRVWADSKDRIWVSEWNSGNVSMYDPGTGAWREWKLPGDRPRAYAVYVDEEDKVWLSDWGANALVNFDPATEKFEAFPMPRPGANVRQIHGRRGEILLPESGPEQVSIFTSR